MAKSKAIKGTKAFLICRVSDPTQKDALPAQELRLNRYSEDHGFDSELFSFDETAYKEDRRKFLDIIDQICEYKGFCILVFDKIDRLTRDCSSSIVNDLKGLIKEAKIELHCPSDNLILYKDSPAADKARFGMGMVFGEYYSAAISDNVKRRIEQKLHDGEWPGKAPIGYKNIDSVDSSGKKRKDIVPDEERKNYIKEAYSLRLQGVSFRMIAKTMRENGLTGTTGRHRPISQSIIENALKNPFYYGKMFYDGRLYDHRYEPLINKQLFDAVQLVNNDKTSEKTKSDTKTRFTFSNSLARCGKCGCTMSPYKKKGHVYMKCSKAKGDCGQPNTSEEEITPQITNLLSNIHVSQEQTEKVLDELKSKHDDEQLYNTNKIEQLRKEYSRLKKTLDTAYDDRLCGRITIDQYDKYAENTKVKLEKMDQSLMKLTGNDKSFVVTDLLLLNLASRAADLYKSSKPELKNRLLKVLLSNLTIDQKRLHFTVVEPFATFLKINKRSTWLRRPDSNRRPIG